MNKITYILCSAAVFTLFTNSAFSQKTIDSLENIIKSDTINKKVILDSFHSQKILKKFIEHDSIRYNLKTDTINKKVTLDSIQTKNILDKVMNDILKQKKKTKAYIDYEIDGLIVAKTISRAGRDFYDIFFSKWEAPKGINNYIIEIKEKPIPQMGTEITILVKEFEIFKEKLPPRYDIIEEYAEYAIYLASDFLKNYKKIQKELNGEDLSGSGIF